MSPMILGSRFRDTEKKVLSFHISTNMVAERGCAPGRVIAVGSGRGPWRIIASVEQLEKIQGKVEGKPQKIYDGTFLPMNQKERKTVEVPQMQYGGKIIDVPVAEQHQVPTVSSRAESGGGATSSIS